MKIKLIIISLIIVLKICFSAQEKPSILNDYINIELTK